MNQGCTADTTEPYALRVLGESMVPEFEHGHIIIVDPAYPLYDGAYVVIEQNEEVFFGQYRHTEGVLGRLEYLNQEFPGMALVKGFSLKGVVVQRSNGRRSSLKHYEAPQ